MAFTDTVSSFWKTNKNKVYALVLAFILGFLGYTAAFSDTSGFLDEHTTSAPTSAPEVP